MMELCVALRKVPVTAAITKLLLSVFCALSSVCQPIINPVLIQLRQVQKP